MSTAASRIPHGLGRSGVLVALGLAIEAISMYWAHPTSFLLFAFVGGTLVAAGILFFLWTIVRG